MHEIIYYEDDNGQSALIDFLRSIPVKDRAKVLREIDLLSEFGIKLTMPHVKKMVSQKDLWELRVKISTNNYRVFYFHYLNDSFVLLHGFQKKSQKTPKREIQTALTRKQRFIERTD
jgi:phage-related protein